MDVLGKVCLWQQQPWVSGEGLFLPGVHRRGWGPAGSILITHLSTAHTQEPPILLGSYQQCNQSEASTGATHCLEPGLPSHQSWEGCTSNEPCPEPAYPKPWGSYSFRITYRSFSNAVCLGGECTHPNTGQHSSVGAFAAQQSLAAGMTGQIPMYIHVHAHAFYRQCPLSESLSQDTFSIPGHSIFVKGLVFLHSVRLPCFHPGFRCIASTPGDFHTFLLNPCSPLGV